ncbi:MAG TPA: chromosome segregation protein SMC [Candidatus Merdivicinus intestinavium]|nr:chromosome segregation protein SMC [Candidatus Merdivicinus intestinavium]
MFLKSLEMQGFKSFPDKTVVRFNRGLTAVVGPNGSGKSNLSDAIRWVLGEQSSKTLRGEKMEDVIFLGTSTRKAQGFAAVSLTFDNADRFLPVEADEVTITRRYYRSGESEYQINGADVRLKDINELFMDTGLGRDGYSMIGQGKIAEIISSRPSQRREIFEEAAGISKYRYRKAEAERKLAAAEENLVRLYDILSELEGRVEPLRVQSEKAKEFLALSARKKTLEISLWLLELEKSRKALEAQQEKYLLAKGEDERLSREQEAAEGRIQDAYARMQSCLTRADEFQTLRQNLQARIAQLGQDEAVRRNDIVHNEGEVRRLEEELSALEAGESRRAEELRRLEEEYLAARKRGEELRSRIEEKRGELERLSAEQSEHAGRLEELNRKANAAALEISRCNMLVLTRENAAADEEARAAAFSQEMQTLEARLSAEEDTLSELEGLLGEIAARQESLENTAKGCQMKLDSRKKRLEEARRNQQALDLAVKEKLQRAKLLEDLEQNMEGFQYSVKAVMKAARNGIIRGVQGTVAQLLNVKPAYSVALETALGGALQNIVVTDAAAAKAGIRYLSAQKAGRATFLPVSEIKGGSVLNEPGLSAEPGFVAAASELVEYDPAYTGIVRFLLGRIAVAEDLDAASAIAKRHGYKFRVVTLDGQQVNVGGSFTGGSAARNQGILSRKNEVAALRQEAEELRRQKAEADKRTDAASRELAALEAQMEGIRAEQSSAREDRIRFEGDFSRGRQNREQISARIAELEKQQSASARKAAENRGEAEKSREELARLDAEAARLREELFSFQGSRDTLSDRRDALLDEISGLSREEAGGQKEQENLQRRIDEMKASQLSGEDQKARINGELDRARAQFRELEDAVRAIREEAERSEAQVKEYEEKGRQMIALRQEIEGETTRLRQEEREISARKEKNAGELARLEEQKRSVQKDYDQVIHRLMDEYEMTRSEAQAEAVPIEDRPAAQQELLSLKNRIRSLGSVNLGAIEEYKEVLERYTFLKGQVEDASSSKAELERLIAQLTSDMERIFTDSFQRINRHFGEIFTELFGGGKASLSLTDPEDVLSSGVEISVQPPGKIIKNLEALSGGEQSFVAIAIYFAILKVRPSPFCVLDEIEAALDDVNVVKYASFLRVMSDKTQFILITHRRGSMEEADVLYGVTMQEQGVSKLLELNVSEIAGRMAELENQSQ